MHLALNVLGPYQTNSYILEDNGEAIIVDVGGDPSIILDTLKKLEAKPKHIVLTHAHPDHVAGAGKLVEASGAELLIHKEELWTLSNVELFALPELRVEPVKPDRTLQDGDVISVGGIRLRVLHTPGHTPGSICLYSEEQKLLFTGDTLFKGSVGRTDLPGGDYRKLIDSLEMLARLPSDVTVYPGHGPSTSIGDEMETNPFMIEAYLRLYKKTVERSRKR